MANTPRSPQAKEKYVCAFILLCGSRPVLDCVRIAEGPELGKPVLYDSIQQARNDKYFDPEWDEVIPVSEYYMRVGTEKSDF